LALVKKFPNWKQIKLIIFDFDGVFTNNKVYVDEDGKELVCCDRSDGLGIDMLKIFIKNKNWDVKFFILSKEKNKVVSQRAKKLKIDCFQGISGKRKFLLNYLENHFENAEEIKKNIVYLGNDLNDYEVMDIVEFFVAPKDAHLFIKKNAQFVINVNGGEGFVRQFIEKLIIAEGFGNIKEFIK